MALHMLDFHHKILKDFHLPFLEIVAEDRFFLAGYSREQLESMTVSQLAALANLSPKQLACELTDLQRLADGIFLTEGELCGKEPFLLWDVSAFEMSFEAKQHLQKRFPVRIEWFYQQDPYDWFITVKDSTSLRQGFISEEKGKAFGAAMYFREHGVSWVKAFN